MALRLVQPGAQVAQLVQDRLVGYVADQGFRTRELAAAKPATLGLAAPHPVFQLGLDQAGQPGAIQQAAMTGWRYLVTSGRKVIAAAHASASSRGGRATFSHLNEGPFVASTESALAKAEAWPEVRDGRYALGLLSVPALYVEALWLRDEDGRDGGDRFVPLSPAPAPLVAEQRYTLVEFEQALADLKSRRGATTGASN
jgi:hypothetical protein